MDKRRRRWFACDTFVYSSSTGAMIFDEFGPVGLTVWVGLLALAKRGSTQGRVTYSSEADLFVQMGLPGINLVDNDGNAWALDSLLRRLGDRKQTTKRQRGRTQEITIRRWKDWQDTHTRGDGQKGNPTSGLFIADELPANYGPEAGVDNDSDMTVTSTTTNVDEALEIIAQKRLQKREADVGPVGSSSAWKRSIIAGLKSDKAELIDDLRNNRGTDDPSVLARTIDPSVFGNYRPPPQACPLCEEALGANHSEWSCRVGQKRLTEMREGA